MKYWIIENGQVTGFANCPQENFAYVESENEPTQTQIKEAETKFNHKQLRSQLHKCEELLMRVFVYDGINVEKWRGIIFNMKREIMEKLNKG